MCDYSLHNVMSTPARVGDELVSTCFRQSSTRGFCAAGRSDVAVCVMPGTELAFAADIESERGMGLLPNRKHHARVARFRQIDLDSPMHHHDALEFSNGTIVLLTDLVPGQRAAIVQLPVNPVESKSEPAGETRIADASNPMIA